MAINPPENFTDYLYLDTTDGEAHINAVLPIVWSQETHTLAVQSAGAATSGVVTTLAQTIAGAKTFSSVPSCSVAPTAPEHLVNKGTMDELVSMGVHWLANVESFYEFGDGVPALPADGDRYIAISNSAPFVANYIYTYSADTSDWIETIPVEGNALYINSGSLFADQCIIFNNASTWVSLGSSINHQSLIGAGTLTHATIDARLGQAVNTASAPSFAGLVVTGNTASTSSTTGAVTCVGGMSAQGAFNTGGAIRSYATTASTSTSTGAIISDGGLGVAGAAYINTLCVTDTTPSTSTSTGCATFAGGLGLAGAIHLTNSINLHHDSDPADIMTVSVASDGTGYIQASGGVINVHSNSRFKVLNTTASTSTTSGALTCAGGVGVAGAMFTGGAIRTTSTAASSSVSTGAIISDGGLGVAGAAYIGGVLRITDTTPSTSTSTGSATFAGGVGVAGAMFVGGAIRTTSTAASSSVSTGALISNGGLGVAGSAYINTLRVTDATNATDAYTGSLCVFGGLGVSKALYVGWNVGIVSPTEATSTTTGGLVVGGGIGLGKNVYAGGQIRTTATTASSSVSTGAIVSGGGLGVAGSAYIDTLRVTDTTASTSVTTGCATFAGGIGVAGDSYFNGKIYAVRSGGFPQIYIQNTVPEESAYMYVTGPTDGRFAIYYTSTNVDPVIRIGSNASATPGTFARVEFKNTAASTSATTGAVVISGGVGIAGALYESGLMRVTNTTVSASTTTGCATFAGGIGVAKAACVDTLVVSSTTASTSTSTGCATFAGGVGIAGALNVGGAISSNNVVQSISAAWGLAGTAPSATTTFRVSKYDSIVFVALAGASIFTVNSSSATAITLVDSNGDQIVIPSAVRPPTDAMVPVRCLYNYTPTIMIVMVETTGYVYLSKLDGSALALNDNISSLVFSFCYPLSS